MAKGTLIKSSELDLGASSGKQVGGGSSHAYMHSAHTLSAVWRGRLGLPVCTAYNPSVPELDSTGTNIHCISDICGYWSKTVRTNQLAATRQGVHGMLGLKRFPGDDTIRNLFRQFGRGKCSGSLSQ